MLTRMARKWRAEFVQVFWSTKASPTGLGYKLFQAEIEAIELAYEMTMDSENNLPNLSDSKAGLLTSSSSYT